MTELQTLCEIAAPTGREEAMRDYLFNKYFDQFECYADGCGSFILHKSGIGPRIMVTAPMDEPSMMVLESPEGKPARIAPVGAALNAAWGGKLSIEGRPGVVGMTAVHLSKDSKDQYPAADKLTLETGQQEQQGQMVVFWPDFVTFGSEQQFIRCKAAANRACVKILMQLAEAETKADLWLVFAALGRLDGRGAMAAATTIQPEIVINIEGLPDSAINWDYDEKTLLLPLMDRGSIHDAVLHSVAKKLFEEQGIHFKVPQNTSGGSGASLAGRQAGGAKTLCIGLPAHYLNTGAEAVRLCDIEALEKLLPALMDALSGEENG